MMSRAYTEKAKTIKITTQERIIVAKDDRITTLTVLAKRLRAKLAIREAQVEELESEVISLTSQLDRVIEAE